MADLRKLEGVADNTTRTATLMTYLSKIVPAGLLLESPDGEKPQRISAEDLPIDALDAIIEVMEAREKANSEAEAEGGMVIDMVPRLT